MKCKKCGYENHPGVRNCFRCQTFLDQPAVETKPVEKKEERLEPKPKVSVQPIIAPKRAVVPDGGGDPLASLDKLVGQFQTMTPEEVKTRKWSYKLGLFYVIIGLFALLVVLFFIKGYLPFGSY